MAFAARNQEVENDLAAVRDKAATGKAAPSLLGMGSKRRAPLGDMSNLAAPLNARAGAQGLGKGTGVTKDAVKPLPVATKPVTTRAKEAAAASAAPIPADVAPLQQAAAPRSGQAPRTRSQTKGLSMSSMLQNRSEAAVAPQANSSAAQNARGGRPPPPAPLPDIDAIDRENPLAVADYVNDIHSYYKRVEPKYRVAHDYMKIQTDINEKMRAILIDWLVEVHLKFKLLPETLFLTVNLIDRFLQVKQVTRRNLQLIGVTAMLISSKYEEIWAPEVRDFVYISDKAYTREQILECEKLILNTLGFHLTLPTTYNFLARFLKAAVMHLDRQVSLLASYVVELALVDAGMLKHSYSTIAAASVYVAMKATGKGDAYPKALARHSTYSLEEVLPCAAQLVELMSKAPTNSLGAVYKKYSSSKFAEVAKIAPPLAITEEAKQSAPPS